MDFLRNANLKRNNCGTKSSEITWKNEFVEWMGDFSIN